MDKIFYCNKFLGIFVERRLIFLILRSFLIILFKIIKSKLKLY